MKKISIILVMLFWCTVGFAGDIILQDCRYSGEGGPDYYLELTIDEKKNLVHVNNIFKNGQTRTDVNKISTNKNGSIATELRKFGKKTSWERENYTINLNNSSLKWNYYNKKSGNEFKLITSGNFQCNNKAEIAKAKKVEIASIIDKAKATCKSLGFKEGTEKFADCGLELYKQSVELAAEQNKTVVMQPQSSGSNTMTIYDPVRDSNALIKQGQRMLSGRCTLGIDC